MLLRSAPRERIGVCMLMYLRVVVVVLSDARSFSYYRGPRLRHKKDEEDGYANQEVQDGTELRIRTRDHPVPNVVDGVPGGVAKEADGHEHPPRSGST